MSQYRVDQLLAERRRPRNALERLVKHNTDRQSLTEQLQAVVSPNVAAHCRVADLRGGRLTIHVAGAAWATRLRFELPKVRSALLSLAGFAAVEEIRILAIAARTPPTSDDPPVSPYA